MVNYTQPMYSIMPAIMVAILSPAVVQDAIGHLKHGKSDDRSLSSDHFISAPSSVYPFLARPFTSILKHGCMPSLLHDEMDHVYVGKTGRTLKKWLAEHKQAVRRFDGKNGIAVHVHQHDHNIDWEGARVVENEPFYWRRRILEAIRINSHPSTMNLDCGLHLSNLWRPFLDNPA